MSRIHTAVDAINKLSQFDCSSRTVKLLRSEYTDENKAYTVTVKIPYTTHVSYANGKKSITKVPGSVMAMIFEAAGEFPAQ